MPTLTVLVGSPASGKSTYAAAHFQPHEIVSFDIAATVTNTPDTLIYLMTAYALGEGRSVCVDATNLIPRERADWRLLARACGATTHAVLLATPPEIAAARNAERPHPVPERDMAACAAKAAAAVAVVHGEGFDRVTLLEGCHSA